MTPQLLSEITQGEGRTLNQLAAYLPSPRRGKKVHLSTLLRWVLHGVVLPRGDRIRLEAARLSGKWVSTAGAMQRFIAAQTPTLTNADESPSRTPEQRRRAAQRAGDQLAKLGV